MKKLILATLLATVSFTTYAQKFVAVKTDIGKDVVIIGNKFYYTPGNGVLEECKDIEAYTGKEDNTERPFYSIIATCKNEIVAIKQYKDAPGGEYLLVKNIKSEKTAKFTVIILKGETF